MSSKNLFHCFSLKINGVGFDKGTRLKEQVVRAFQALLFTSKEWQLCLVKPSFDRLDSAKVSLLENPLTEEGIFFGSLQVLWGQGSRPKQVNHGVLVECVGFVK